MWLAQRGLQIDAFDIAEVGVAKAQSLARQACVSVRYAVPDSGDLAFRTVNPCADTMHS